MSSMKIVRYYEKPAFRTGIISQATIFTKQSLMELQAKFYKNSSSKKGHRSRMDSDCLSSEPLVIGCTDFSWFASQPMVKIKHIHKKADKCKFLNNRKLSLIS